MSLSGKVVAVVGGGPAGLMAAEVLAAEGVGVNLYDAKPTVGRKFLIAGRGGLNLTHAEPLAAFARKYGEHAALFDPLLARFSPDDLRTWAAGLGIETFVGTSGRVFPKGLRSTPLLRAWIHRLREQGVRFHPRHRWLGFAPNGGLRFERLPGEPTEAHPDATVLALGGASYPHLGSDGQWVEVLQSCGVEVKPLEPSNCGFHADWSETFRERSAGEPLKNVRLFFQDHRVDGELMITRYGVEGGAVYALSGPLRDAIARDGRAVLLVDLKRDLEEGSVTERLSRPGGKASMANLLRKRLRLTGPVPSLLRECLAPEELRDPRRLAARIKRLPITLIGVQPIEKAISTAGGVAFAELTADLMLRKLPGVFVAGEMLDYDAPTGGYLLQAAFSTGVRAADGVVRWLGGD
jgi:uncharacterized flavoprotein (TIGR03862 family)